VMVNKRRGHGEGSIYQRKDGRWVASLSLENRKRKYFYGDTRREVQEKLKAALHEQQQGTLVTARQQTLKQFLERWLEDTCKPVVRLTTYIRYRDVIKNHLVPAFGHVTLQKLTSDMLRAFLKQKSDSGLKPTTVTLIRAVLHRALEDAVKDGLVARNVVSLVKSPHIERHEAQMVTVEQAKKLLEAARGTSLDALLEVALTTAMRRGEILALRWSEVDLERGTAFVRRTLTKLAHYGVIENEPKTKAGRRRIELSSVAVEALKRHQTCQEQVKLKAGDKWQDKNFVFCDENGRSFVPGTVVYRFEKLLKQVGLPHMRFHDMRHSAATILLAAGVHPKKVQELLGHSSIMVTMDVYSHVLPSMQKDVANEMDDLFG